MRLDTPRRRGGFTLIELIIAIAIMAVLAGVVAPVASTVLKSKSRAATKDELVVLTDAIAEYFRDTGAFPATLSDLSVSPGATGWSGPYIQAESVDPRSGMPETAVDAWSKSYALTVLGPSTLEVASAGEDLTFGTSADITRTLDVTPIRREQTLQDLDTINQAIGQYNAQYLPDAPLPTSYTALLSKLVSTGFLPSATPFQVDGWGDPYAPYPAGQSPVVQVASVHVSTGVTGGTSGGTKTKGKKGKGKKGKGKGKH